MKRTMVHQVRVGTLFDCAAGVAIAGVLVYSGLAKLLDISAFIIAIAKYDLTSDATAVRIGTVVPFLELAVGIAMISFRTRAPATIIACTLFVGFLVIQLSALVRGLDIACGCFGGEKAIGVSSVGLASAGFIVSAVLLFRLRIKQGERACQ